MPEISHTNQVKLTRKYIKLKLLEDNLTFRNHTQERTHVYDLIKRTITHGESHSALMIGPRGSGKTTLINSVLHQLSKELDLESDAIIVKLNGLIHSDEKIALKSITAQMQLENAVGEKVFGTFAENLAFLLSCLQSGADRRCKSMVFILEEFHMFCHSGRIQTLLYNLFDITHNEQSPMCVLGVTNRIDVMELLEKRVKSRFSHRHIMIFPNEASDQQSPTEHFIQLLRVMLSLPPSLEKKRRRKKSLAQDAMETDDHPSFALPEDVLHRCKMSASQFSQLSPSFVEDWNAHVESLCGAGKVIDAVEKFCYYSVNEQLFRNVLFQTISKLGPAKPFIDSMDLSQAIDNAVAPEHRVKLLHSLSVLELSLVIAMMHGMEIFDGQPMNFEMVLHRYMKFANTNSSTQTVPRPVILKAFEHLNSLELIQPSKGDGTADSTRVQKEYKLYMLSVPADDVREAVRSARNLPTEIAHWLHSDVC